MNNWFPGNAFISITKQCNLRCEYCFCIKHNETITKEIIEKTIQFLISNALASGRKNIKVTLFGGEPTLYLDLCDYVLEYGLQETKRVNLKFQLSIITNGMIFNEQFQNFILKCREKLGGIHVQLSYDGLPEVQSISRQSFENKFDSGARMDENITKIKQFCKDTNFSMGNFSVHAVINKKNLNSMFDSFKYFYDNNLHYSINVKYEEQWTNEEIKIFDEEYQKIFDFLVQEDKRKLKNKNFGFYGGKVIRNYQNCGAGHSLINVDANGDVYPCHRVSDTIKEYKIGNILDYSSLNSEIAYKFRENDGKCKGCSGIGCRYCFASRKEYGINPSYCAMRAIQEKYQHKAIEVLNN